MIARDLHTSRLGWLGIGGTDRARPFRSKTVVNWGELMLALTSVPVVTSIVIVPENVSPPADALTSKIMVLAVAAPQVRASAQHAINNRNFKHSTSHESQSPPPYVYGLYRRRCIGPNGSNVN